MKRNTKMKILIPTIYIVGVVAFSLCLVAIGNSITKFNDIYNNDNYVVRDVFEEIEPVINNEEIIILEETVPTISSNTIIKPYTSDKVVVSKNFYEKDSNQEIQENSIIYYKGSYIQNKGTEYSSSENFDVVNVIDGTVKSIKKDSNLGYIVTIEHENEITTLYQYLSSVNISEGAKIKGGDVIGISGKSIIENDNNYTLHFEFKHKEKNINPETLYTLTLEDFK